MARLKTRVSGAQLQPAGIALRVRGDLVEHGADRRLRAPAPELGGARAVHHHPRHVEAARVGIGGDLARTEALRAPCAELREGNAVGEAAAQIDDSLDLASRLRYLRPQERHEIACMQAVAHLIAASAEADVL